MRRGLVIGRGRYRLADWLGRGGYAEVWQADVLAELDGRVLRQVAVKVFNERASWEECGREIEQMAALSHENVLRYVDHFRESYEGRERLCLVMELADGGSLEKFLKAWPQGVPGEQVGQIVLEVARALAYIHEQGRIHRDVKPQNMLMVGERVKLGDVGLMKALEGEDTRDTGRFTLLYAAPEVLNSRVGQKSDVWGLGATAFELLTGHTPFCGGPGTPPAAVMRAILEDPVSLPANLAPGWQTLLSGCLEKDPQRRWRAEQVVAHLKSGLEEELTALREALGRAQGEVDGLRQEVARLRGEAAREEGARQRAERALQGALARGEAETRQLQVALEASRGEVERASRELEQLRVEGRRVQQTLEAERGQLRQALEAARSEGAGLRQELEGLRVQLAEAARRAQAAEAAERKAREQATAAEARAGKSGGCGPVFLGALVTLGLGVYLGTRLAGLIHASDLASDPSPATPIVSQSTPLPPTPPAPVFSACAAKRFRTILPGYFVMGSPAGEEGRDSDETQHRVRLTHRYQVGITEVTQADWEGLMGNNPSNFKGADRPVEGVSWYDAVAYCNALSRKCGLEEAYVLIDEKGSPGTGGYSATVTWKGLNSPGFRLPTEAEWENAARAGSQEARPGPLDDVAWYGGNSDVKTHPVGGKQPNAWGLYDMVGNVWEWGWDRYAAYPLGEQVDPTGPSTGSLRIYRGGSSYLDPQFARVANRSLGDPGDRRGYRGFRVVRSLP